MRRANRWTVRLSDPAKADVQKIVEWTAGRFGPGQAATYAITLAEALKALSGGPAIAGVRRRETIGPNLYTLHVARARRRGRHFILFRVDPGEVRRIVVVRVLHEAMDIARQVPPGETEE